MHGRQLQTSKDHILRLPQGNQAACYRDRLYPRSKVENSDRCAYQMGAIDKKKTSLQREGMTRKEKEARQTRVESARLASDIGMLHPH